MDQVLIGKFIAEQMCVDFMQELMLLFAYSECVNNIYEELKSTRV